MNQLTKDKRRAVIAALVEGNSIRATVRMTGVAKNTVTKLLVDLGRACAKWHFAHMRNIKCRRIQCDEIWTFCYAKQKNLPPDKQGRRGYGDVWTWVAIDADTKLAVSYLLGARDFAHAQAFIADLAKRLANKVQLTTDGHRVYLDAVARSFASGIDYAMLVKVYGADVSAERTYSPPHCIGATKLTVFGEPDSEHISTSYVERQNLTMRMGMRRFTRLTNGFSKKIENLFYAVALHFMYYNFCRIHQTLRITPAMAAGVADKLWGCKILSVN